MLMNHDNIHFTQIPDKTNDVIFLKSPKTMFLGHFRSFLPDGDFFPKNQAVKHNYIWAPKMLSFRKELMSQSRENVKKEGWMDRPYFIGLFQPMPGFQRLLFRK